jgi:hypothetical protein
VKIREGREGEGRGEGRRKGGGGREEEGHRVPKALISCGRCWLSLFRKSSMRTALNEITLPKKNETRATQIKGD